MADAQRARGRARGRAKPPQAGGHEAPRAVSGPPPTAAPPSQQVPRPQGPPVPTGRATHRGAGRPVDEQAAGLAQKIGGMTLSGSSVSGGNGNGNNGNGNGAPVGRGHMRGKRQIFMTAIKTRPENIGSKQGTSGQKITLQANYFALESRPNWRLNQYRVDFEPTTDLAWERRKLLRIHRESNIKGEYLFDGTMLFCAHKIEPDPMEVYSQKESDGSQVRITIRRVGEIHMGDYQYIQLFNILTRNCFKLMDLQLMRRDYFDPKAKIEIPEYHLELWPGYETSIRQHEQQILMVAEIRHKVMRTDTCLQLLQDCLTRNRSDFKDLFTRAVVGSVVLTTYNNSTYTISDVNWDMTPSSRFDMRGTPTSYTEYYSTRYNLRIKDERQPLLVSKSRPRLKRAIEQQAVEVAGSDPNIIFLVPEFCKLTGITDEMRSNFQLMRAMATHTRIGPADRIQRLMTMNRRMNGVERVKQELQNWSLRMSDKLVELPGRVVQAEQIVLGNSILVPSGEECDWTRHLRSNPMFVMPQGGLSNWVIIFPRRVGQDVETFVETLRQAGRGMKFAIAQPEYVDLQDDRNQSYLERMDHVINSMNPQLIFVVLLSNKADKYSAIKKKSLVDRAVPTQVLLAKNLNKKGVMSIATKVAIQINCKIGGAPWSVQIPLGGLMVVGFDVCHDSKSKSKSYGAMVASLNKPMSRYFSAVSHHEVGQEMSNDLAMNIFKALNAYKKHNQQLPSHIIIYRDGVGDGQIPFVYEHEVKMIEKAAAEVYGTVVPKIAVIVVCKRITARLFANRNNPRPGTVVDDVITLPERYDFFLISQHVTQGTVSPTSYNVIKDNTGLDADKIQRLTYKLTHTYYNWSGTVRVPAPVQYAHKLAFLVSQSLHRAPNTGLEELLYFL